MLTVHGRTVHQNKQFVGEANWDIIKKIKQSVCIPIIANGGISCRADALQCLHETGCDAIMSSEALLENPKLFSEIGDHNFHNNFVCSQLETVDDYIQLHHAYSKPKQYNQVLRGHLFKMLFRFIDAPKNSDLRLILAEGNNEEMFYVVSEIKERMSRVDFESNRAIEEGFMNTRNWYMRHRGENASTRILPRRKVTNSPKISVKGDVVDEKEMEQKLSDFERTIVEKEEYGSPKLYLISFTERHM